jgi:hypothetical protein
VLAAGFVIPAMLSLTSELAATVHAPPLSVIVTTFEFPPAPRAPLAAQLLKPLMSEIVGVLLVIAKFELNATVIVADPLSAPVLLV